MAKMAAAIGSETHTADAKTLSTALDTYNQVYNTNIQELKPLQVKALSIILYGKDCVCSLPTGYGKSLIFELLPFIDLNCLVIVIEPLNVIKEQETKKLGETAICLSGKGELGFNGVKNGKVKYIFCHPEDILDNKRIVELFKSECVKSRNIFLVADEAHCILDWGDHFRPHYKRLSNLRSLFECQILALSATVTSVGQRDIIKNLLMKNCECVCASPTKENIELIVLKRPSATAKGNSACTPYDYIFERVLHELNDDCKNFPVTIIYCNSIQWLGYGYELAREILEDNFYDGERTPEQAKVVMFHSSMEDSNGKLKQMILASLQKPSQDCNIRLIFASVALGMGADLKNVKRVIHAGPPSTLETYVQEIGRAGRVGGQAKAILYYNNNDITMKHMQASMKDYCRTEKCKRDFVNEHFGFPRSDETDKPQMCCNVCQYDIGLEWDFSQLSLSGPLEHQQ